MTTTTIAKAALFDRPRHHGAHGTVEWHPGFEGWLVGSYPLVDTVLRDHGTYSADERRYGPPGAHTDNPVLRSLLALDPPEHHRLRRLVGQAFTPKAIDRAEERIADRVATLLDELGPEPEVVAGFASPLTTGMLAALLGLPDSRRDDFVRWTHVVAGFAGPDAADPSVRARLDAVLDEMERFVHDAVAGGGLDPDGVLATLCRAVAAGELTERELLDFTTLLIAAGHETTTRLVLHAVLCLDRYPDQLDLLRTGAADVADAIEEVARHLPPTGGVDRFTTTATTLGGVELAAGTRVVAMVAAANRDPEVFADPHRFDVRRRPNPHLGFGRGAHACLGAHLARREARLALRGLLDHVPGRWSVADEDLRANVTPVGIDLERLVLRRA